MTEAHSLRYWFALIVSSLVSLIIAIGIIVLSWYLLWKFVLSRFAVIRALLQIRNNDQPPQASTTSIQGKKQPPRRQNIRRE